MENVSSATLLQSWGLSCPQRRPAVTAWGKVCKRKDNTEQPFLFTPSHPSNQCPPGQELHHNVSVPQDLTNIFLNLHLSNSPKAMNVTLQLIWVNLLPPHFAKQHIFLNWSIVKEGFSQWMSFQPAISFLGLLPYTADMGISGESFLEPLLGPLIQFTDAWLQKLHQHRQLELNLYWCKRS